jgi:hypothetical protein
MRSSLRKQFQELAPRVKVSLIVLAVLLCFLANDRAGRAIEAKSQSLALVLSEIETLESAEAEEVAFERKVMFDDLIEDYEARIVDEGSVGLNIARLQSDLAETLAECGLDRVFVTVEAKPFEQSRLYTRLRGNVRARDNGWVFPVCLARLGSLGLHFTIEEISWNSSGNLLITLSTAARIGRDA